jgi:dTDP-4-dehydrorhamnose 3,5-epimerase
MLHEGPIIGVEVRPLRVIRDDRGAVWHMLRADTPRFTQFGEVYFSEVAAGRVKAWRRHRCATANLAVPRGRIRFVAFDDRPGSRSRDHVFTCEAGESNYVLITVPPGVWNGFLGLTAEPALVANCSTLPHRPDEEDRLPADTPRIPYVWFPENDPGPGTESEHE